MNDPFADVREWLNVQNTRYIMPRTVTESENVEELLTDADALLEVARDDMSRAFDEWLDLAGKEKAESFKDWLENVHPLLAALPKRLKK